MNLPNSMTVGRSYSEWLGPEDENYEDELPEWNKLEWAMGEMLDAMPEEHQYDYLVTTEYKGNTYEGIGTYSCGKLINVEDIERK